MATQGQPLSSPAVTPEEARHMFGLLTGTEQGQLDLANATYMRLLRTPSVALAAHLDALEHAPTAAIRRVAAVLLHKLVYKPVYMRLLDSQPRVLFEHAPPGEQRAAMGRLLAVLGGGSTCLEDVGHAVSALATWAADGAARPDKAAAAGARTAHTQWPEFVPWLVGNIVQCPAAPADADSQRRVCMVLAVFGDVCRPLRSALATSSGAILGKLKAIVDSAPQLVVRVSALKAVLAWYAACETPRERRELAPAVPDVLRALGDALRALGDAETGSLAYELFDMLHDLPSYELFEGCVEGVSQFLRDVVVRGRDLDDRLHLSALELLVSMLVSSPSLVRAHPKYLEHLVDALFEVLYHTDTDLEQWLAGEVSDYYSDDKHTKSEHYLRLVSVDFGEALYALVRARIRPYEDWRAQHTCLLAMSNVVGGAPDAVRAHLGEVHAWALGFLRADVYPRLRWAALRLVAELCTELAPEYQQQHGGELFEVLRGMLADPAARVRSTCALALGAFVGGCERHQVSAHLEACVRALLATFERGTLPGRLVAVDAMTAVLELSDEQFAPYCGEVMRAFTAQLQGLCAASAQRTLASAQPGAADGGNDEGTYLEAQLESALVRFVTALARAVPDEVFGPFGEPFVRYLLDARFDALELDDPRVNARMQACSQLVAAARAGGRTPDARLSGLVRGTLVPAILAQLTEPIDAELLTAEELRQRTIDPQQQIVTPLDEYSYLVLPRAGIESVEQGLRRLGEFASALGADMYPVLELLALRQRRTFASVLQNVVSADVRCAAAACVPFFAEAAVRYERAVRSDAARARAQAARFVETYLAPGAGGAGADAGARAGEDEDGEPAITDAVGADVLRERLESVGYTGAAAQQGVLPPVAGLVVGSLLHLVMDALHQEDSDQVVYHLVDCVADTLMELPSVGSGLGADIVAGLLGVVWERGWQEPCLRLRLHQEASLGQDMPMMDETEIEHYAVFERRLMDRTTGALAQLLRVSPTDSVRAFFAGEVLPELQRLRAGGDPRDVLLATAALEDYLQHTCDVSVVTALWPSVVQLATDSAAPPPARQAGMFGLGLVAHIMGDLWRALEAAGVRAGGAAPAGPVRAVLGPEAHTVTVPPDQALGLAAQAAQYGAAQVDVLFSGVCAQLRDPAARHVRSAFVTDNAVSALGKAVVGWRLDASAGALAEPLGLWLAHQPLTADHEEIVPVLGQMCAMLERPGPRAALAAAVLPEVVAQPYRAAWTGGAALDTQTLSLLHIVRCLVAGVAAPPAERAPAVVARARTALSGIPTALVEHVLAKHLLRQDRQLVQTRLAGAVAG